MATRVVSLRQMMISTNSDYKPPREKPYDQMTIRVVSLEQLMISANDNGRDGCQLNKSPRITIIIIDGSPTSQLLEPISQ